ncbi:MAG: hypothetical protein K6D97_07220, partial [Clostridia bacterium]|nr:hypothetical protein [Clostridia bacterium]
MGDVLEYSKNQLYILRLCDDYFGIIFPVLAIFSIYFENKNIAGVSLILYCLFENINIIVNSVINIWCKGNVLLFVGNFILCIF